jgi:hypothetical protein
MSKDVPLQLALSSSSSLLDIFKLSLPDSRSFPDKVQILNPPYRKPNERCRQIRSWVRVLASNEIVLRFKVQNFKSRNKNS